MSKTVLLFFAAFISCSSLYAQMHIAGDLFIAPGATVAVASHVTSDTDILGGGRLLMNGNNGIQILNMNGHVVPRLGVANPDNIVLASNAIIGDSLMFISGKIITPVNDLVFSPNAHHDGAGPDKYVVTNGVGLVIKRGLGNGDSFLFPVGNDTGTNNYTPALITNAATQRDIRVLVKDYNASAAIEHNTSSGIDRTWFISSNTAGSAGIALTHNASTEGSLFDHNAAFVTQQLNALGTQWSIGTPSAGTNGGLTHIATLNIPQGITEMNYFSKSSDATASLLAASVSQEQAFLRVIPNPFIDQAILEINATEPGKVHYYITDAVGRAIISGDIDVTKGSNRHALPVEALPPGAYMIHASGPSSGSFVYAATMIKH